MRIDEGLLLYGVPVPISGLGHLKSPKLKEIFSGITSLSGYRMTHTLLCCKKSDMKEIISTLGIENDYQDMSDLAYDEEDKFGLIIHSPYLREMFSEGLSLFFDEKVTYDERMQGYALLGENDKPTGVIIKSNYRIAENMLRQVLFDGDRDSPEDLKFASEKAKELWEKANRLEEKAPKQNTDDYQLTNIISKLSCANIGYTIFSIYELTVYQLYDQFYAYCQNRIAALSENAYAHNGGEDFDCMAWMHKKKE